MDLKRIFFFKLAFRWHVKIETLKRRYKHEIEYIPPKRKPKNYDDENDLTIPIKVFPKGIPAPLILKRKPHVLKIPNLPTISEGKVLLNSDVIWFIMNPHHRIRYEYLDLV